MRKLVVVATLVIASSVGACSPESESAARSTSTEQIPPRVEPTQAPVTTPPATTPTRRPGLKLVVGRYCAIMHAAGWSYERAAAYYEDHGRPAHMDADSDGIPCETVYPEAGEDYVPPADLDPPPSPSYVPPPSYPTPGRTPGGSIDHDWPTNPGPGCPGCTDRPVQPYPAPPGDPNDRDGDGVACEYGCKN
jgi:excalibur calcium-binding domain-containing protein